MNGSCICQVREWYQNIERLNNKILLSLQLTSFLNVNLNTDYDGTQRNIKQFTFWMNLWQKKNTSKKEVHVCDSYWLVVASTAKIITQAKHPHLTGWRMFWIPRGADSRGSRRLRWQRQPPSWAGWRITMGFTPPTPHLVRNRHPRKTKINSEGAFPGSSSGVWPRECWVFQSRVHM